MIRILNDLNINLIDHIILTLNDHFRFKDNGLLDDKASSSTFCNIAIVGMAPTLVLSNGIIQCLDSVLA